MKKFNPALLLGAVTGAALIAAGQPASAELIDGVNKELICKRPKQNENQLKLHSCATFDYGLIPLEPATVPPEPEPVPPYSS